MKIRTKLCAESAQEQHVNDDMIDIKRYFTKEGIKRFRLDENSPKFSKNALETFNVYFNICFINKEFDSLD